MAARYLRRKAPASALAAIKPHGRGHHGLLVIRGQTRYIRALWHAQNERGQHRAADNIHEEPVALLKVRQSLKILRIRLLCVRSYRTRGFCRQDQTWLSGFSGTSRRIPPTFRSASGYISFNASCGLPCTTFYLRPHSGENSSRSLTTEIIGFQSALVNRRAAADG